MPGLKRIAFIVAAVFFFGLVPAAPGRSMDDRTALETLLEGPKVVNIVDDFLLFWDRAEGKTLSQQRRLWMRMVESKHRDFFDRAVYRNADREQRRSMLNQFLLRAPWQVEAIRQFNESVYDRIIEAFIYFSKVRFREYRQQRDIYIGLSLFTFDGSVRAVQNEAGVPDTLCLGADVLADYTPEQARITIIHEFFHLYHFSFLFQQSELADLRTAPTHLLIEGMAVAGSEEVYQNQPPALYLHFSDGELAAYLEELGMSSRLFLELVRNGATPDQYEPWFGDGTGDVLPRAGYLLGYEVTKRLLASFTLEQMVRMTPAQLREHAEEQLAEMATDQILVMAGGRD